MRAPWLNPAVHGMRIGVTDGLIPTTIFDTRDLVFVRARSSEFQRSMFTNEGFVLPESNGQLG